MVIRFDDKNKIMEKAAYWLELIKNNVEQGQVAHFKYKNINPEEIKEEENKLFQELDSLSCEKDDDKLFDMFYKDIEFGTGGLRGIVGVGSNRMNLYTVAKTTQGIANYINSGKAILNPFGVETIIEDNHKKYGVFEKAVAISYDSRNQSEFFAKIAAEVLSANGLEVYLYEEMMPTPTLSYAVRDYKCVMGIMITASHNPAEYNGYKVYDQTGCQLGLEPASELMEIIEKIDPFKDVKWQGGNGIINIIGKDGYERYMEEVYSNRTLSDCDKPLLDKLNIVYTPLNGVGNKPIREMLKYIGISNCHIVKSQELPDGNFPTCPYPNPEKDEALSLGIKQMAQLAKTHFKNQDFDKIPDGLIATDPDSDRVAIISRKTYQSNSLQYIRITGNQVGILMLDYLIKNKVEKNNRNTPFAITTFVSSKMVAEICKQNNVHLITTLTGFKFIAGEMFKEELRRNIGNFVMGFEESIGYLVSKDVRDKDAVSGAMIICEMMAKAKAENKTLYEKMDELYEKYGYIYDDIEDFVFKGIDGKDTMNIIMEEIKTLTGYIGEKEIVDIYDFQEQKYIKEKQNQIIVNDYRRKLPKTKCLEVILNDNCGFCVRPSGTEPKIKFYFSAFGKDKTETMKLLKEQKEYVEHIVKKFTNKI